MKKFYRYRFPSEIILLCVRWYLRYKLTLRDLEEMMLERGIPVSHESIRNWIQKFSYQFDNLRRRRSKHYTLSWHVDETYVKVNGENYYYYRAIDSSGQVIDFFLSHKRDAVAAEIFLRKVIATAGSKPEKITSDADKAYPKAINDVSPGSEHRVNKYLNNKIEWDHHARVKNRYRVMKGFKNPKCASNTLKGIEGVYELFQQNDFKSWFDIDKSVYNLIIAA